MYKIEYLPSAMLDILEAEDYLYKLSTPAADRFTESIERKTDALKLNPLVYKVYAENGYFRCMTLPYKYLCFYHVDEDTKTVKVHRILRGMRDIPEIL